MTIDVGEIYSARGYRVLALARACHVHNDKHDNRNGNGRRLSVTAGGMAPVTARHVIAEQERPDYHLSGHLGRNLDVYAH